MKTLKKTLGLAAVISATLAVSGVATSAFATEHEAAKATKKAAKKHHAPSDRALIRADEKHIKSDEARIANLEAEVGDLRAQIVTQKQASDSLQAKEAQLETQVAKAEADAEKGQNLLFFRGGYASLTSNRHNELLTSNTIFNGAGYGNDSGNGNGWYVGTGLDFRLSDNAWGMSDMISVDGELFINYANYGQAYNGFISAVVGAKAVNQVTQLTIAASPKVKFNLMDGDFRPWVIPFGLSINVVSPPSSGVTVLNPGLMLGTGAEYRLWKDIWLGADFRYQFTGGDMDYRYRATGAGAVPATSGFGVLNQTPTQGLFSGAYIGVGF